MNACGNIGLDPAYFAWFARVVILCALSACSPGSGGVSVNDDSCLLIDHSNSKIFLGSEECVSRSPTILMTGYLSVGLEESVFLADDKELRRFLSNPEDHRLYTWLYLDKATRSKIVRDYGNDNRRIYKISFFGSIRKVPGIYGHMGIYGSGATIKRLVTLKLSKASEG